MVRQNLIWVGKYYTVYLTYTVLSNEIGFASSSMHRITSIYGNTAPEGETTWESFWRGKPKIRQLFYPLKWGSIPLNY